MTSKTWIPHNYQRTGISFLLSNPISGLFQDPGLGKTSISLSTIKVLKYAREMKGVLLIAPLRVCYSVWPVEIKKWSNFNCLSHTIIHGDNKGSLWGKQKDIYIINPENLKWLHKELLTGLQAGKKCPFDILWIDESTKFKNHESSRFQLVVDMLPLFKRRHIMTGTPAPKGLIDLWSQTYLLDEGKSLGHNFHKFRNKYFQTDDWNKHNWYLKDFCEEEIHNAIAPLVLEMAAKDYLDMPSITYNNINVQLPAKAFKQYKQMEKEYFIYLDDMEASADQAAQVGMKCHQIANGKVYEDIPEDLDEVDERAFRRNRKTIHIHKAKIEALQDLIDELNGKPLLIAYHYKHDLEALRELLGDVPFIGSGVTPKKTNKIVSDWNDGKIQILLGHPTSMAHGLNLQASGNDICWFSLTWNLEEYLQFNARLYRQGIVGAVRIHHLIAEGTIDEAMLLRLGERTTQQHDLRNALKQYRLNLI